MSVVSAGCVLWLERFQPVFVSLAVCALGYQAWLVWRRPPHRRTPMMLAHSLDKSRHKHRGRRRSRRTVASLSVAIVVLCAAGACRSAPEEPERHDGFRARRRAGPRHHVTGVRRDHGGRVAPAPGRRR